MGFLCFLLDIFDLIIICCVMLLEVFKLLREIKKGYMGLWFFYNVIFYLF